MDTKKISRIVIILWYMLMKFIFEEIWKLVVSLEALSGVAYMNYLCSTIFQPLHFTMVFMWTLFVVPDLLLKTSEDWWVQNSFRSWVILFILIWEDYAFPIFFIVIQNQHVFVVPLPNSLVNPGTFYWNNGTNTQSEKKFVTYRVNSN